MDVSLKCGEIGCNFKGFLGAGGFGRVYKIEFDKITFAVKTFKNDLDYFRELDNY